MHRSTQQDLVAAQAGDQSQPTTSDTPPAIDMVRSTRYTNEFSAICSAVSPKMLGSQIFPDALKNPIAEFLVPVHMEFTPGMPDDLQPGVNRTATTAL